ncbi:MAG: HEAT repeat domain-containing protein [Planctomyces sp.]
MIINQSDRMAREAEVSETAESELIAALHHSDVAIRIHAARELHQFESPASADALIQSSKDVDADVRAECLRSLGWIRSVESLPLIREGLRDECSVVREAAASAIWYLGSNSPGSTVIRTLQSAVPELIAALTDRNEGVRVQAAGALGCTRSTESLLALFRAAGDRSDEVRRYAVWAIGRIGDVSSVTKLLEVLHGDSAPIVRRNAAVALSELAAAGLLTSQSDIRNVTSCMMIATRDEHHKVRQNAVHCLASLPSQQAVTEIVRCLSDNHPDVRKYASWALGEMSAQDLLTGLPIEFAAAVNQLVGLLSDSADDVRRFAVWAIGTLARKTQTALARTSLELSLMKVLTRLEDEDPSVRKNAAWTLSTVNSELVVPGLIMALRDSDPEVRSNSAFALGCTGSVHAIAALSHSLADPDVFVRRSAAENLRFLATLSHRRNAAFQVALRAAVQTAIQALNDRFSEVRVRLVQFLGEVRLKAALPKLTEALGDSSPEVRREAVIAMKLIGAKEAVPSLISALRDVSAGVRREALISLSEVGDAACIPALRSRLNDKDEEVRHCARIAILRIPQNRSHET